MLYAKYKMIFTNLLKIILIQKYNKLNFFKIIKIKIKLHKNCIAMLN